MEYLRWQQAGGRRHALVIKRDLPTVDTPFTTLCGLAVTPLDSDFIHLGGRWLDPTCLDCEKRWRAANVTATGELLGRLTGAAR